MKTFKQTLPALKNFINNNAEIINKIPTKDGINNLNDVLSELQFAFVDLEESNIIAFYLIAYFANGPLEWINFSDIFSLERDGTLEVYIYDTVIKANGWNGAFRNTNIKHLDQLYDGTWIKEIHYPSFIERILLAAKRVS